jgi:sugar O-acyltransferase (sialic acid O-acetyltransferase NeuD family)
MNRLIIIGAGGHGRVVADAASVPAVFLDEDTSQEGVIGKPNELSAVTSNDDGVVVAIGDNSMRLQMLGGIKQATTIVHESSVVGNTVTLGVGTVVFAGAIINAYATLGIGCIVNTGATVDHDCQLADGVHISPGANLGGNVTVGKCSWIGIGACVKNGVTIGKNVVVGAGAAVVQDVPDNVTVVGVPAKELT